ncbi:MAG: hypothetical protein ABIM18_08640, partial [candidate division WOR-3 bacterium]
MTEREKEILVELLRKELRKEDSEIIRLLREELAKEGKRGGDVLDKFMGESVRGLPKIVRAGDYLKAIFSGKTELDLRLMWMKMPIGEQLKIGGGASAIFGLIMFILFTILSNIMGINITFKNFIKILFVVPACFILAFILFIIGAIISPEEKKEEKDDL